MTASGLPIDGESLLRFKKHHAPVTFEAAHTTAVVLDTLSSRQLALAALAIVGSCTLAAATAGLLGLTATRRETIDTYDCKALTSGPWQDRATRERPCRGADGRTESLASGAVVEMEQTFDYRFHHSFELFAIVVPRNDHSGRPMHGEWTLSTETSLHGHGSMWSSRVAAWDTYGCSLGCLRLQPWMPTVAAWGTYGCSLEHIRLQPGAHTVAGGRRLPRPRLYDAARSAP